MRKSFFLVLVVALFCFVSCQPNGETAEPSVWIFVLNSDGASYTVVKHDDLSVSEVVIPSEYNGKPVTDIGEDAFFWHKNLTDIVIPESIISIKKEAFFGCSALKELTIPSGVTTISSSAFWECSGLEGIKVSEANLNYYSEGNCLIEKNQRL